MPNNPIFSVVIFLIFSSTAFSQESIVEEFVDPVVDSNALSSNFRLNYAIKGSAHLTKTFWQLLNSFPSEEDAENIWQTALSKAQEMKSEVVSPKSNVHANIGQVLSLYYHSMNQSVWEQDRLAMAIDKSNIANTLKYSSDLQIYFNLEEIWSVLIAESSIRENMTLNAILNQTNSDSNDIELIEVDAINNKLIDFNSSFNEPELAEVTNSMKALSLTKVETNYYHELIKLRINKQNEDYLKTIQSFFNVASFWVNHEEIFVQNKKQIEGFNQGFEEWISANQETLDTIDLDLRQTVSHSLVSFKSALESEEAEFFPPTIFDFSRQQLTDYLNIPLRQSIQKNLTACLDMSKEFEPYPQEPININQFNGCLKDISDWVFVQGKSEGLAGKIKNDNSKQLLKHDSPSWQSINAINSYFSNNECQPEDSKFSNPLEWLLASETLLWFADRWPAYMQLSRNQETLALKNKLFSELVAEGKRYKKGLGCLQNENNQSISELYSNLQISWQEVQNQINAVSTEFSVKELKDSSDLNLLNPMDQKSDYRVQNSVIGPCDENKVCGVYLELEASKSLFGLFPSHLLLADQLKLGDLSICYDDVGWDNRKTAATHLNNNNVANYIGNLSVHLKGMFNDTLIFDRKITSKEENLYLFGKNSDEVLETYCPIDIIGEKISTELKRGTFGLVPNRLTFLTASRVDETTIMSNNWHEGEEWQDKFTQDDAVQMVSSDPMESVGEEVQSVYLEKSTRLQNLIYQAMNNSLSEKTEAQENLANQSFEYFQNIYLLESLIELQAFERFLTNDDIHGVFFGSMGLLNKKEFQNYQLQQVSVENMIDDVDKRISANKEKLLGGQQVFSNTIYDDILLRLENRAQN